MPLGSTLYDAMVSTYEKIVAVDREPNVIVVNVEQGVRQLMRFGYAEDEAREFIESQRTI